MSTTTMHRAPLLPDGVHPPEDRHGGWFVILNGRVVLDGPLVWRTTEEDARAFYAAAVAS